MSRRSPDQPDPARPVRSPRRRPDADGEPVLPDVSADERDIGWGDERDSGRRDDDWYRRERPPHHE